MTAFAFDPVPPTVIQTPNYLINPSDVGGGDDFGQSVSLDSNQLVVGSPSILNSTVVRPARIFNFDTGNNTWDVENPILLEQIGTVEIGSQHGAAVSILGNTAVVGAPKKTNASTNDGSVFIYTLDAGSISNTEEKVGSGGEQFGTALSQTATLIAVGAPRNSSTFTDGGAIHIYENEGGVWSDPPVTKYGSITGDLFGTSVSLFTDHNGTNWLAVGAPSIFTGGSVQVFEQDLQGDWGLGFQVLSNDQLSAISFGESVTLTETYDSTNGWLLWLFVGDTKHSDADLNCPASGYPNPNGDTNGIVEVFQISGDASTPKQTLFAPDCFQTAQFGNSLDASGEHVAIGSYKTYSCDHDQYTPQPGAGYVANYDALSNFWTVDNKLFGSTVPLPGGQLGKSISIDGEMIAVGGPGFGDGGQVLTYTLLYESLDCNVNSNPDALEFCNGTALDCNNNQIIDSCDIASGTSLDCDSTGDGLGNGIPDECELAAGISLDCNENGVPDECDLNYPELYDCDGNGVLDACEITDGLHIIFIIDGSGSISSTSFEIQKNTVKHELCLLSTYANVEPLFVSVIQICEDPDTYQIATTRFIHGAVNQICEDIDTMNQRGFSTKMPRALQIAQSMFIQQGSSSARIIILMSDGNTNWGEAQAEGNLLRSMTPPVRIGTGTVHYMNVCGSAASMSQLANTNDTLNQDYYNLNQPEGFHNCMDTVIAVDDGNGGLMNIYEEYSNICLLCLAGWDGTNDCNANGQLDACEACPADIAPNGGDGVIDVSDLLAVVSNWGACPVPCPWDIDCSGAVDVGDMLAVIGTWGCGTLGGSLGVPQTVQDCLDRYPLGSLQLEKCLEIVEYLQNQTN